MNKKMVFRTIGRLLQITAVLLVVPMIVALIYGEAKQVFAFGITALGSLVVGVVITLLTKTKNKVIYARDGFAITALAWIGMALVGAVPFVISGDIPSYVDAFFETVSGFTTTGSSILLNVEEMCRGMLYWRSFTHWVGGMGVLVFLLAIVPMSGKNEGFTLHILRAESPGPSVGKLVPRMRQTAMQLSRQMV